MFNKIFERFIVFKNIIRDGIENLRKTQNLKNTRTQLLYVKYYKGSMKKVLSRVYFI